jgi:peptidoglycan lytic transglycosylase G
VVVVVNLGSRAVRQSYDGPGAATHATVVVVPSGGLGKVAAALRAAHVIAYPLVFRAAAWLTRKQGPVRAGEFAIPAHASLHEILGILRHGPFVEHQVTIAPGLTAAEVAAVLNAAPAARGTVAASAIPDGGVLPQTYDYLRGAARSAILARAAAAMRKTLAAAWALRAPGLPLASPEQALILASIVQQESPVAAELPHIASVYENRLHLGMKLQADPTVVFATGHRPPSLADLAVDSPYNTYIHAGLPPGPICSPGTAAIAAVLHPAASDDLYFVATGAGGHVFSHSFSGQLANIARYRDGARRD